MATQTLPFAYSPTEYGRMHYSSETMNKSFFAPTLSQVPGVKWTTKKFDSGIRASAANERYKVLRSG